jgi:hypothetical protein
LAAIHGRSALARARADAVAPGQPVGFGPALAEPIGRHVEMPVAADPRGKLCFIESGRHVPFEIRRVYYLYDLPEGATRARHAHVALNEVLFPLAGAFTVRLDNGGRTETHVLDRPNIGLHIGPMIWRELDGFTPGAVCLVLASAHFDEADYICDYDDFLARTGG